jgi:hypothetical protein
MLLLTISPFQSTIYVNQIVMIPEMYSSGTNKLVFVLMSFWYAEPVLNQYQARSSLYANTQLRAHRRAGKKIKSKKNMEDYQSQSPCRHANTVLQSEVGIWSQGVILQRVRHRAISLLNSSKLHVRSVWYVSYKVAICSFVIFPITRGSRYCA